MSMATSSRAPTPPLSRAPGLIDSGVKFKQLEGECQRPHVGKTCMQRMI